MRTLTVTFVCQEASQGSRSQLKYVCKDKWTEVANPFVESLVFAM